MYKCLCLNKLLLNGSSSHAFGWMPEWTLETGSCLLLDQILVQLVQHHQYISTSRFSCKGFSRPYSRCQRLNLRCGAYKALWLVTLSQCLVQFALLWYFFCACLKMYSDVQRIEWITQRETWSGPAPVCILWRDPGLLSNHMSFRIGCYLNHMEKTAIIGWGGGGRRE